MICICVQWLCSLFLSSSGVRRKIIWRGCGYCSPFLPLLGDICGILRWFLGCFAHFSNFLMLCLCVYHCCIIFFIIQWGWKKDNFECLGWFYPIFYNKVGNMVFFSLEIRQFLKLWDDLWSVSVSNGFVAYFYHLAGLEER